MSFEMTHQSLCDLAVKWLQRPESAKGHGCHIAISEVATGWSGEIPDAIGFRAGDGSVLVEVKVSRPDFLADKNKPHRNGEAVGVGNWRYYMAPEGVLNASDIPAGWGLLSVNSRGHIKHIISPFLEKGYIAVDQKRKEMRFDSDTDRELFLLVKLLSRLGDIESCNKRLKEASNAVSYMQRQIEKMRKREREMTWRAFRERSEVSVHG